MSRNYPGDTAVAYDWMAGWFSEQANEGEQAVEGWGAVAGGGITAGTTGGTIQRAAGYAEFDGILTALSALDNLGVCPFTVAGVTLTSGQNTFTVSSAAGILVGQLVTASGTGTLPAGVTVTGISGTTITISANANGSGSATLTFTAVDATNPRWGLVELTPSGAVQVKLGTPDALPVMPVQDASTTVYAWLAIPAGATAVDTLVGTNNGNVKIMDARIKNVRTCSGWVHDLTTWTRVSGTQFTITSAAFVNYTTRFAVGTKLRWAETGTVKYGHVASSSYNSGTGVTTVNLVANSDYTMAASPDTASEFYSYATPPDFPVWFNYAATTSGWASGGPTGDVYAHYAIDGHRCTVEWSSSGFSSNITSNSSTTTVSLPITFLSSDSSNSYWGSRIVQPVGTGTDAAIIVGASKTIVSLLGYASSGNKTGSFQLTYQI